MIAGSPSVAPPGPIAHNHRVREDRIFSGSTVPPDGCDGPTTPDIPGFRPERCAAYLAGTDGSPPRMQLVRAVEVLRAARSALNGAQGSTQTMAARAPVALDIGCGPGREVVALLEAGFEVDALDPYPEMLERTRAVVSTAGAGAASRVRLAVGTLEDHAHALQPGRYDLVHAGFVLPFVRSAAFERCWSALVAALAPDGVFAGQFFGPNDEFIRASQPGEMTSHARDEVGRLFADWRVVEHEEVDRQGAIGRGVPKWWHVHHIVAIRGDPIGQAPST